MPCTLLDGRATAEEHWGEVEAAVDLLRTRHNLTPALTVLRVGEDPASVSYARAIERSLGRRGIEVRILALPEETPQDEILDQLRQLNQDPSVNGIMVQEPLPRGLDAAAIRESIAPEKDVDGVHPLNAGRLAQAAPVGRPSGVGPFFVPATPAGGLALLKHYQVPLSGRHAVVVGRSNIVGKPMALLLLREHATVTLCHSRTANLADLCRTADLLCVAVGRAELVRGDWIKPGAVVVDFGINVTDEGKLVGDVAFEEAQQVAGMLTPVPGGTGPMTNVMLARNLIQAVRRQHGLGDED